MPEYRKRNRLKDFDYSKDNFYFITACVYNRNCFFGDIASGQMQLNVAGKIVLEQWLWLEKQYPYVFSHAFVVMPNHIHGIIEINRDKMNGDMGIRVDVGTGDIDVGTGDIDVGT